MDATAGIVTLLAISAICGIAGLAPVLKQRAEAIRLGDQPFIIDGGGADPAASRESDSIDRLVANQATPLWAVVALAIGIACTFAAGILALV